MTTLATMKSRIAREIDRDDLTSAIEDEISSAITYYQSSRFWFNEKRSTVTFDTVIGQTDYTAADNVHIPYIIRIDYAVVAYGSGDTAVMTYAQPRDMEILLGNAPVSRSRPYRFSYYESFLRLYPEPDQVYPVRVAGVVRVSQPSTDSEAGNPWMVEAEELIRARAKRNIYLNSMLGTDPGLIATMKALEDDALDNLRRHTSAKTQVSRIVPSCL
jgi:hypothetical protein